jgi:hypothetical protein
VSEENKRQLVEEWLHDICMTCEMFATMEDDYHPGEYDKEIAELLDSALGLVSFVEYEPGSDEWESFEAEGYLWQSPTDGQVEKLYPAALQWLKEREAEGNDG